MSVQELAARNRAAKLAQLERLRPTYYAAKQAEEAIYSARKDAKGLRVNHELMQKLKFIPGFFPTPANVVERMLESADLFPGCTVLEPSAGKGNIAVAVRKWGQQQAAIGGDMVLISCIEKNFSLAEHLRGLGLDCQCADFMEVHPDPRMRLKFDRVLMNPPFENRQDVAHVKHAHGFLNNGGRLVAIVSSTGASILEPWVADNGGTIEPLPQGSFKTSERPTGVNCAMITITT